MDIDLSGRHALVCGASYGIGRAAARSLAARGAEITALARSADRLESLLPELLAAGASSARALVADLDDREALGAGVDRLLVTAGPVHVLLNNTGGPPAGPILDASADDFVLALGRHLLAGHLLVRRCLPGMRAAGYGRIINVVSTSVYEPLDGLGVSNTTRGAVAAWAKSVSRELPPGVTINNVLPGFTDTGRLRSLGESIAAASDRTLDEVRAAWLAQVPEGRLAEPRELGDVIAFLASPAASYVRGVSLPVDGGKMRKI